MTLTELRYIVTLAQEHHFGRAAERCHISQPTLSIAVKKLEQELDVELFERSKNSVRVTPTGEKVVAQAQRVLEQASTIHDIASEGHDQLNTPLHVGAIFTIGPYLYPHFIPQLQKLSPQMSLVVEEGYTASLRKRLRNGELDVIIVALPFTEPDVVTQPLYTESFVMLLPASHPLTAKEHITVDDLDSENVLLMGDGHCFREQVLEAMPNLNQQLNGSKIRTHTEGSSLETLRHMVATGLGVSILPVSAAVGSTSYTGTLVTRPFSGVAPSRTAALAWRASFPRHKAIDALRQAIQKSALPNVTGVL